MKQKRPTKKQDSAGVHVWLVFMKAFQALLPHAAGSIKRTELGDSDFRVLEVLLNKGPLPVNTIGPKVWLTPGSISVAVDRLVKKGLVSRGFSSHGAGPGRGLGFGQQIGGQPRQPWGDMPPIAAKSPRRRRCGVCSVEF